MFTNPTWPEIAVRLALATLAGMAIGYNREARSQAAGLRTTTLVCVAACLSMVLANQLLYANGPESSGFIRMDVMRLPLGVLTGIGFIGAGAIVRRGDAVIGVATAATLWFMTLVGLVIGAGELLLGVGVTGVGLVLLSALEWADHNIRRRMHSALLVFAESSRLPEAELRGLLDAARQRVVAWAVTYHDGGLSYEVRAEVEWYGRPAERAVPPAFLEALGAQPGVRQLGWTPQAVSA